MGDEGRGLGKDVRLSRAPGATAISQESSSNVPVVRFECEPLRACIDVSIASRKFSAETALVVSHSSINMRNYTSRAAYPRVNEAAVAGAVKVARMAPVSTQR